VSGDEAAGDQGAESIGEISMIEMARVKLRRGSGTSPVDSPDFVDIVEVNGMEMDPVARGCICYELMRRAYPKATARWGKGETRPFRISLQAEQDGDGTEGRTRGRGAA
jgi:hypothetical protein